MYEISLVPDIKAQLIQKQKMRNLIIFICIIVAVSCGGVLLILSSIVGGQAIQIGLQENEIKCRIDASGDNCSRYNDKGDPVLNTNNLSELLTIQDQMNNIGVLNNQKIKFSRIFGVLDVILPNGDDVVKVNEINANIDENSLTFEATGTSKNNIGFRALEAFKKTANKTYFDYGSYMRMDEDGSYVEIPSFCIEEKVVSGRLYGFYKKGSAGCEAPLVEKQENQSTNDGEKNSNSQNGSEAKSENENNSQSESETKNAANQEKITVENIPILRTYRTSQEKEEYKLGKDPYAKKTDESNTGKYYFESKCLVYKDDGSFDEDGSRANCPLVNGTVNTSEAHYGKGDSNEMILNFSARMIVDSRVFLSKHKHMQIIGPDRQNVTDSYVQIRNMFGQKATASGGESNGK